MAIWGTIFRHQSIAPPVVLPREIERNFRIGWKSATKKHHPSSGDMKTIEEKQCHPLVNHHISRYLSHQNARFDGVVHSNTSFGLICSIPRGHLLENSMVSFGFSRLPWIWGRKPPEICQNSCLNAVRPPRPPRLRRLRLRLRSAWRVTMPATRPPAKRPWRHPGDIG